MPARNGDERHGLGIVTNLLNEIGCFFDNFVEAILTPLQRKKNNEYQLSHKMPAYLGSVHFVNGHDELAHTKGEGEECVFTSLAIFGDTSFEFTSTTSNDEDSAIGLGGTGNHVFDEVTVTRGVDDLDNKLGTNNIQEKERVHVR